MQLPQSLHHAIQQTLAHCNVNALSQAVAELSDSYRSQTKKDGVFMKSEIHRLAYLATRMPATFAANGAVLSQLPESLNIASLLDLGAGPGTASWAATTLFPQIQNITLIEQDAELIALGQSLARNHSSLQNATWHHQNLTQNAPFPPHDLVICSYALNELSSADAHSVLTRAWTSTGIALVLVEPGTMLGFEYIRQHRQTLIDLGAHIMAPCPHPNTCPIPQNDWCHFSQRINRSALHRQLKIGYLGYEDEKFSYLIATKSPIQTPQARVLRHPQRRSGHTQLQLCTPEGLETHTVTRSNKALWRQVRKTNWGDTWP